MRTRFSVLIGIALIALGVACAWGAEEIEEHAAAITRAAATAEGERAVVRHLSQELDIPASDLEAQRRQTKLGWGELLIAHRLAQRTGLPFEQVVEQFRSGKGWGRIAKDHGVSLGELVSEVKESRHAVEGQAHRTEEGRKGSDRGTEASEKDWRPEHRGPGFGGRGHGRGR